MTLNVGVWCVVSAARVIGPILFSDTGNLERYAGQNLLEMFLKFTWWQEGILVFPSRHCSCVYSQWLPA